MTLPECMVVTCLGCLMVTLGAMVLLCGPSDPGAFPAGTVMIVIGTCCTLSPALVALCQSRQSRHRSRPRRLLVDRRKGRARGHAERLVVASTYL